MKLDREKIVERFLAYTRFDTQSNAKSDTWPSTPGQIELGKYLMEELRQVGLSDIEMDENGYVMATLPGNTEGSAVIGFITHMDTATDLTGKDVKARVVKNYPGGEIVLNEGLEIALSPKDFPEMENYIGDDIVVTDGTTLLGADNKGGICSVVSAVEYLLAHPEIPRPRIRIGFTPDEEIGRGGVRFDVEKFGADFAYTIDGGSLGNMQYETFNAADAQVTIRGRSVHPGTAKNQMINALQVAYELNSLLPSAERPEYTNGYEGFFHLKSLSGAVDSAKMHILVRDFDREKFEARKNLLWQAEKYLNLRYGEGTIQVDMWDMYYNMREVIEPVMPIVDLAREAMEGLGITPKIFPFRGGTDGSIISHKGLPCPNLFEGGHNYHGKYEFLPVGSLEKSIQLVVEIAKQVAEKKITLSK
ncbi:MAG: peptidase T [Negativicutes bacterium]|nr:peptidase T [Negativicutes bacterium]